MIKGLSYENKSYLQILMNCLFGVNLIKDDWKKYTYKGVGMIRAEIGLKIDKL